MTATITIPDGFIAGDVPEAVRKLVPKGMQLFRMIPLGVEPDAEQRSLLCLAVAYGDKRFHADAMFYDRELSDPASFYERFILPASEALRSRIEKVKA